MPEMIGRYAPVARLGKGGMADVFLTLAHGMQGVNKLTVVKRLRHAEDPAMTKMFFEEACLGARFDHPNIVDTYEMGEARGEYFIVMEYLEGQALSRLMKTLEGCQEGLPEPLVAFIAIQALKGLHYAHEFCDVDGSALGIVHRDVSPHNIVVTYDGEIKVLDFGIAKVTRNGTHTESGVIRGKVRYMAPEQASQGDVDRRADVYAFGIVLWEMLARRPLFTGDPVSILTRIVNEEIPPVRSVRPDASPVLAAIALKATRRNRDERYATAEEMRLHLEAYLRECGHSVSERDLARVMNDLFAPIRDDVRACVKDYVATMPPPPRTLEYSTVIAHMTSTENLPVLSSWAGRSSAPSWTTAALPSEAPSARDLTPPPQARSSRQWVGRITIALFIGAAAVAPFVMRSPLRSRVAATAAPPAQSALPARASTDAGPDSSASSAPPSTSSSALPPAATNERRRPHALPLTPSPASSPSAPAPSVAPSAPTRYNIRLLDESESP